MRPGARSLLALLGVTIALGTCAACQPPEPEQPATEWATPSPAVVELSRTPSPAPRHDVPTRSRPLTPAPGVTPRPTQATVWPRTSGTPVDLARADLARRLNVDLATIQVVDVRADEFPASNLGCPEKAPKPMPALVTGVEIVLAQGNGETKRRYVYRARKGQLVYCGPPPQVHKSPRP